MKGAPDLRTLCSFLSARAAAQSAGEWASSQLRAANQKVAGQEQEEQEEPKLATTNRAGP